MHAVDISTALPMVAPFTAEETPRGRFLILHHQFNDAGHHLAPKNRSKALKWIDGIRFSRPRIKTE
jgi:hypothetical protein